ncbi:ClpXP protease specificity-enhancing factor SspB [Stigmatella aurantiaca]|uniref:Stringent starvation family protein B n=2 Tax=Stigmatella aurantiaca (strain DW4/3-1) TaxID=378806 RepID=E3FFN8_STIAD|nr:ClpXP protease specificity-enhancing factor SspB [Stigmatella aurantiaca]ADO73961.1 Stringent starvation family protein B [Stigmatella aurantiaca DW4/3-1]
MDKTVPDKKERLLAALEQGLVMVHLDARRPGVLVPPHLRNEAHLRLNISYRFDPPDLAVGEWGVRSTLSFSGSRFTVAVPWSALFAITSHVTKEFWLYPDDIPVEFLQQTMVTSKAPLPEAATPPPAAEPRARTFLREVPGERTDSEPAEPQAQAQGEEPRDEPPSPPPRRGHLRLVK